MVPGSCTDVDDRSVGASRRCLIRERRAQAREMPCSKECVPSLDHLGGVARTRHQVHVALARDVE